MRLTTQICSIVGPSYQATSLPRSSPILRLKTSPRLLPFATAIPYLTLTLEPQSCTHHPLTTTHHLPYPPRPLTSSASCISPITTRHERRLSLDITKHPTAASISPTMKVTFKVGLIPPQSGSTAGPMFYCRFFGRPPARPPLPPAPPSPGSCWPSSHARCTRWELLSFRHANCSPLPSRISSSKSSRSMSSRPTW